MPSLNPGKIYDQYERGQEIQDALDQTGLGKPPPSGLVPLGDTGLYTTPGDAADPRDCDRYPDSPYCGGNPLDKRPIAIDIETTAIKDDCGVMTSATVKPTLGFIKLPPVSVAQIPENCREKYEQQGKQNVPPPPSDKYDDYQPTPQYPPHGFNPNDLVCVVLVDFYYQSERAFTGNTRTGEGDWYSEATTVKASLDRAESPTGDMVKAYNEAEHPGLYPATSTAVGKLVSSYETDIPDRVGLNKSRTNEFTLYTTFDMPSQRELFPQLYPPDDNGGRFVVTKPFIEGVNLEYFSLFVGRFGDIFPSEGQISPVYNSAVKSDFPRPTVNRLILERFVAYCKKVDAGGTPDRRPPPPKKPPRNCCEDDMGCCQPPYGNKQEQDNGQIIALLRKLDKKLGEFPFRVNVFDENEDKRGAQTKPHNPESVAASMKLAIERNEKLAKILGIDLLPISVPKTVIEKKGEGIFEKVFGFLDFSKNEDINSVLEMQVWVFKQISTILGHWMMEIEVEDSDALKEGDQQKNVVLPNMALTMREQIVMQVQTLKAVGMLVDMQIKALIDLAGTKVLSAECAARLEDLQMYLDYETQEVTEDLPLQITIPTLQTKREDVENLANFLKEGKVKVSYDQWTVKKSQSLEEKMIQLLEMSSALRALYFHGGA